MQFEYQKYHQFFAQCAGGSEEYAMQEVKEFGVKKIIKGFKGFHFETSLEKVYRINYQAKLITRILAPLMIFPCHKTEYLYRKAIEIPWENFFSVQDTFAVHGTVINSKIKHSKYAALCLKDAIVDRFRKREDERPSVDRDNPTVQFNLFINRDKAIISVDTSGGSLHKRGYKQEVGVAPMNETLASTIIRLSGWNGKTKLWDPLCGSGTILAEALIHSTRQAPAGLRKNFGFEHLPDFDQETWLEMKAGIKAKAKAIPKNLIFGSDIDPRMIEASKLNLKNILFGNQVQLKQIDFRDLPKIENATIITNPPYGIRMGETEDLEKFYRDFGDFLKQKCKNSTAWIYVGNRELIKSLRLKPTQKIPLKSGALDGRLIEIKLY